MKILDKFDIYTDDKYNISIKEYKEIFTINKETKEKESKGFEWVKLGVYFGTLKMAVSWLKEEIIRRNLNDLDYKEMLMLLYQIDDALSERYGVKI